MKYQFARIRKFGKTRKTISAAEFQEHLSIAIFVYHEQLMTEVIAVRFGRLRKICGGDEADPRCRAGLKQLSSASRLMLLFIELVVARSEGKEDETRETTTAVRDFYSRQSL